MKRWHRLKRRERILLAIMLAALLLALVLQGRGMWLATADRWQAESLALSRIARQLEGLPVQRPVAGQGAEAIETSAKAHQLAVLVTPDNGSYQVDIARPVVGDDVLAWLIQLERHQGLAVSRLSLSAAGPGMVHVQQLVLEAR